MSKFFNNFPLLAYNFGDETKGSLFQNISAYISIIDEVKDEVSAYNTIFIDDDERPDTLSYKLYNDESYYWTFFYLNEDIRESGWPMNELEIYDKAKLYYPNYTVTTRAPIHDIFLEGDTVLGLSSGTTGVVVKRYLDLGQIVIAKDTTTREFRQTELIRANNNIADQVALTSSVVQYNSVHHYENSSKIWTDIDPFNPNLSGLTPITYLDRILAKNTELREIKVFTTETVTQIQSEFNKLLLRGT